MIEEFNGIRPQLDESVYLHRSALVCGDVQISADSSVWPTAVIRGDVNRIRIGARTNIQDASVLHVSHAGPFNPEGGALQIGDDVTVGHKVILHACSIGNGCLIGMGSIVMDRAVIESGSLLGAGSLVTEGQRISSGYLWLGQPARQIRPLTKSEQQFLLYSAQHYVRLKEQHRSTSKPLD